MTRKSDKAEEMLEKQDEINTEEGTDADSSQETGAVSGGKAKETEEEEPEAAPDAEKTEEEGPEAAPDAEKTEEEGPEVAPDAEKTEEEKPESAPEAEKTEEEKPEAAPEAEKTEEEEPESASEAEKTEEEKPDSPPEAEADDDSEDDESEEGGGGLNLLTFLVLLIAVGGALLYYTCTVRTVKVTGNQLYTSEEIAAQVISDNSQLRHNTVFLTALYMTPLAPKIPFEESVRVIPESYDTITIAVKDMDLAGFIPYAGKNLYFSAEGIVLEKSPLVVKNATFVTGLSITEAEIGKKMVSENESGQAMILETLQILKKYDVKVESVVLTSSGNIVFYMDDIKVQLGQSGFELKITKIAQILPYLEGRSGTIDLTNYTSPDQNIILK